MNLIPIAFISLSVLVIGCSQKHNETKPSEAELARRHVACDNAAVYGGIRSYVVGDMEARIRNPEPSSSFLWNIGADLIKEEIAKGTPYAKDILRTHEVVLREYETFKDLTGDDLKKAVLDYALKACIDG